MTEENVSSFQAEEVGPIESQWVSRFLALERLAAQWEKAELPNLQRLVEDAAVQAAESRQTAVLAGRREVAAATREFSQVPVDRKLKEFGSLLKRYQRYIDDLTAQYNTLERFLVQLQEGVGALVDPSTFLRRLCDERKSLLELIRHGVKVTEMSQECERAQAAIAAVRRHEETISALQNELHELQESTRSLHRGESEKLAESWHDREQQLTQELGAAQSAAEEILGENKKLISQIECAHEELAKVQNQHRREEAVLSAELNKATQRIGTLEDELEKHNSRPTCETDPNGLCKEASELGEKGVQCESIHSDMVELSELAESKKQIETLEGNVLLLQEEKNHFNEQIQRLTSEKNTALQQLDGANTEVERLNKKSEALSTRIRVLEESQRPLAAAVRELERQLANADKGDETVNKGPLLTGAASTSHLDTDTRENDLTLAAVLAQRDRLRQRLVSFETAANTEIAQLQRELRNISAERDELIAGQHATWSPRKNSTAIKMGFLQNQSSEDSGFFSISPRSSFVINLDRANGLLQRNVFAYTKYSRWFILYLFIFHLVIGLYIFFWIMSFVF